MQASLLDFSPLLRMLVLGAVLACGPLVIVYVQSRNKVPSWRLRALASVTLFLTFDLVLFGAFTRLTDSGLGCPDWPGCYGHASPLGAFDHIEAAQQALPTGPVTWGKAWVEMVHRYLAMGVGALITVQAVAAWWARRAQPANARAISLWWAVATWVWVCVQGAFGALTVTMKLFPAIVTLHLLGGYILLALLTVQVVLPTRVQTQTQLDRVSAWQRLAIYGALGLLFVQAASGAWVSTNYAVLACADFPACQGSWWPSMDFAQGFEMWRPLGYSQSGASLSFQALTAIHFLHRMLAALTVAALVALAWHLWRQTTLRNHAQALAALLLLQMATGVGNVVLNWPLVGAVLHTGGAGALVVVLVRLLVVVHPHAVLPSSSSAASSGDIPSGLRA